MQEHRRTHRLDIQLSAQYRAEDSDREFADAVVMNINVKGMCLVAKEPFTVGQVLVLRIELPDQSPVTVEAKVIWCKDYPETQEHAVGLQLVDVLKDGAAQFVRFYAKQLLDLSQQDPVS